jgi:YidC/Oxa1 family membrane protein insertase
MDTRRLILFVIFSFSIMMLWDAWQQKNLPAIPTPQQVEQGIPPVATGNTTAVADGTFSIDQGQRVKVTTDLFEAEIDTTGGDLRRLILNKHRAAHVNDGNFVLMDDAQKPMLYIAQTGLLGDGLPNHKSQFTSKTNQYTLAEGANSQVVRLTWTGNGITVDKVYTFNRGSYVIGVAYQINNGSELAITPSAYYQIVHDSKSKQGSALMPTFTGGAYYTEADKFKKISFADMETDELSVTTKDGWIGVIEHYFASA